jgi:hypothetical protein
MSSKDRPRIVQVGRVTADGWIRDWGIASCLADCSCHLNARGSTELLQDNVNGLLGLVSFRPGCTCCRPWSIPELLAVLESFAQINQMETTS